MQNKTKKENLVLNGASIFVLARDGGYGYVDDDINDVTFKSDLANCGEWEWNLFEPECSIDSDYAHAACSTGGWRPATIHHLLVFGVKFPEAQKMNPIVALGSRTYDAGLIHCVPMLDIGEGKRQLLLAAWAGEWTFDHRFLRVRWVSNLPLD